jgi:hypothetical protein
MHPAHGFAACQLRISFFGLRHQKFGFLQVDDGIGLRTQASDALQRGLHQFLA